jgi:hypothetical protein
MEWRPPVLLTFGNTTFGTQKSTLNLQELYPDCDERKRFHTRLDDFLASDAYSTQVFTEYCETLEYSSEVFISNKVDNRPSLLLLLGNPATHSVAAGLPFAFERNGQEHRFWK